MTFARARARLASLGAAVLVVVLAAGAALAPARAGATSPHAGLGAADRREALEEIVAPPLVIHHAPEQAGLARDLAERGPGDVARICRRLGLPAPSRIDAWLLPRRGPEPGLFGLPEPPEWAGGYALTDRPEIVVRTTQRTGPAGDEAATVFTHELVHCIVGHALGPRRHDELPAWFGEGLATHVASEWRLVQSAHAAGLALSTSYVPLRRLEARFPADGAAAQLAYLQSFAFVEWLVARSGEDALRDVMARLLRGESFDDAFRGAFGAPWSQLEDAWRPGFLLRYRWLPILTSSATLWMLVSALFVAGAIVRRRRMRATLEQWAREEALLWPDDLPALPGAPAPGDEPREGEEPPESGDASDEPGEERAPAGVPPGRAP